MFLSNIKVKSSRVLFSYLHAKSPLLGVAYVMSGGSDGVKVGP